MKPVRTLLPTLALACALPAQASTQLNFLDRAWSEVTDTYRQGSTEYYLPFHTWHAPWAYTKNQDKQYQNWPPGFGIGRGRYDERGNWHGIYAMGFQDSHFKPEWAVAYGWKTYWQVPGNLRLGLGFTAGFTARTDYAHYFPVPLVLPVVSVEYGKLALEGAFVPGGKGYGNVMLFWFKWHTDGSGRFGEAS